MVTNAFVQPSPQELVTFRQKLGLSRDERLIGGFFRLQAEKRHLLWLEDAARVSHQIPNTRFVIFGDGTMRDQMLKLASRVGLRDRVLVAGNTKETCLAIAAMDVFLLTSS